MQVKAWRETAITSQDEAGQASAQELNPAKGYRNQIKQLEREITRKNSALAEAAALPLSVRLLVRFSYNAQSSRTL